MQSAILLNCFSKKEEKRPSCLDFNFTSFKSSSTALLNRASLARKKLKEAWQVQV
jgi:hypothetical protein